MFMIMVIIFANPECNGALKYTEGCNVNLSSVGVRMEMLAGKRKEWQDGILRL